MMNTVEKINQQTRKLSEVYQTEVLDFVEFLVDKTKTQSNSRHEEKEEQKWRDFSLSEAMRGMEDEDIPEYTEADLI
jgi:hypothetical protein